MKTLLGWVAIVVGLVEIIGAVVTQSYGLIAFGVPLVLLGVLALWQARIRAAKLKDWERRQAEAEARDQRG